MRHDRLLITAFFVFDSLTGEDAEAVEKSGGVGARTFS
jgi:hypothetical protein